MKKIKFASEIDFITAIQPSHKYVPNWFKSTDQYLKKTDLQIQKQRTFKHCLPFIDAITCGYTYELWCDLEVSKKDGVQSFHWKHEDLSVIEAKSPGSAGNMPIPEGYSSFLYGFITNLYLKTPPGYSLLITQPLNRMDTPFLALSGLVDTDKEPMFPGSYPFFIKNDFEGVVQKGTPLLQIIPIKRDSWIAEEDLCLKKSGSKIMKIAHSTFAFWYKKNAWFRKSYE
jgi:hypothetical protein